MAPDEPDAPEAKTTFDRRYQAASEALDSATQVVAMMRLVAHARSASAGGVIVVGGERVRSARRVGLIASSMNPLTRAHVALAEAAGAVARLDVLCWVATAVTIDKEHVERATLADRLVQAQAYAHATGDGLLLLTGGLYVEQARAAHTLLATDADIALVVGFDKVVQIFDPHYYDDRDAALRELFAEAELVVAPRADASEADLRALLARPENQPFAARVTYCPLPARYATDSSTEARTLAATGGSERSLRALLTPEGLALAQATRPYAPAREPGSADLGDEYRARQTLLAALDDLRLEELVSAPALTELVAWSAEESHRGAALRGWAKHAAPHTYEGLRRALAAS